MKTDENNIFTFANGISVLREDLLPAQIARYATPENANIHEPEEEVWFEKIFDASQNGIGVFLDIGAAVGYYSILVRKRFPEAKLFAVDPLPSHIEAFWRTLDLNKVSRKQVHQLANAVGPSSGTVEFAVKNYSSHLMFPNMSAGKPGAPQPDMIKVSCLTLAEILDRVELPVDLAKMDIQGPEERVLRSSIDVLQTGKVKTWIIGTHGAGTHRNCVEILNESYNILYENSAPAGQPDGIIVASFQDSSA